MTTSVDVTYWHLTYDDDDQNSHKFYDVYVIDREVTLRWGRVDTNGQHKVETRYSVVQAENIARTQVNKKVSDGYKLEINAIRVSIESGWFDTLDMASKVERALKAHTKPTAVSNRLATITELANEIVNATKRKGTAAMLTSWSDIQNEWEQISVEYRHAEAAMVEAERVITARLMGG